MSQFITQDTANKYEAIRELQNAHLDASFTIGTESGNVINVAVQLKKDKAQTSLAERRMVQCYLSGAATGASIVGTAPNTSLAIGTNGAILNEEVTDKLFKVITNASGQFDINISDSGTPTFYLVVVMPNGRLVVSSAITFA